MILVDTSVWIDFFHKSPSPESQVLTQLLESEMDIAICGLVRQEILQGVRDDIMLKRVRNLLNQAHYFALEEPKTFDEAAGIYRNLRKKGITLISPMDCLIAAIAIQYETPLLHKDSDFIEIARFSKLALYQF